MSYRRLEFVHPHLWHASLPSKRWDAKNKKYVFPPKAPRNIAVEYEQYLLSQLVSHALRILNLHWELDDDTEAMLTRDLENHAVAAGKRAGVTFSEGRSSTTRTVAGNLSRPWLRRAVRKAVPFATDHWDPVRAEEIHRAAVKGGETSRRTKIYKVNDLPPGSITAQMEALNASRSTIKRLRREVSGVRSGESSRLSS